MVPASDPAAAPSEKESGGMSGAERHALADSLRALADSLEALPEDEGEVYGEGGGVTEMPNPVTAPEDEPDVVSLVLDELLQDVAGPSALRASQDTPRVSRIEQPRASMPRFHAHLMEGSKAATYDFLSHLETDRRNAECDTMFEEVLCDVCDEHDEWVCDFLLDEVVQQIVADELSEVVLRLDETLRFIEENPSKAVAPRSSWFWQEPMEIRNTFTTSTSEAVEIGQDASDVTNDDTDSIGDAVDDALNLTLEEATAGFGDDEESAQHLAAQKIQAVHRGNVGRRIVSGLRMARGEADGEAMYSEEDIDMSITSDDSVRAPVQVVFPNFHGQPSAPSDPQPSNKSVRRRLVRLGLKPKESARVISGLDDHTRNHLYRKIELAFAFDLQGGSVLEGPDVGQSRKTDESPEPSEASYDDQTKYPYDRADANDDDAASVQHVDAPQYDDPGPDENLEPTFVPPSPRTQQQTFSHFPNLLEDGEDKYQSDEDMTDLRELRGFMNRESSTGGEPDALNSPKLNKVEKKPVTNEARWARERRQREQQKLQDERRRFELLKLELDAIERRREEQRQAREEKKQQGLELKLAREENTKLERQVMEERRAWENKARSVALRQVGNVIGSDRETRARLPKKDPLYKRMQHDFEEWTNTTEEELKRLALEDRRARKTGGVGVQDGIQKANKHNFQHQFEQQRRDDLGLETNEYGFLPDIACNDSSLHQAQTRFMRQKQYGAMVKQLHKPRVSGVNRMEIVGRKDSTRPGFEDAGLLPVKSGTLNSRNGDTLRRVYDKNGVGRFEKVKTGTQYSYGNPKKSQSESELYDINGRRISNADDKNVSTPKKQKDGPFGPFPKNHGGGVLSSARKRSTPRASLAATQRSRAAQIRAAEAAMHRANGGDIRNSYSDFHERDPRYDPRRDRAIGFDPRLDDRESFLETLPKPVSSDSISEGNTNVSTPKKSPKGKGFRTMLRERQLVAIEARLGKDDDGDGENVSHDLNAYHNLDDIPCVGASTFGRTKGLKGLEDLEGEGEEGVEGDSLDGSEPRNEDEEREQDVEVDAEEDGEDDADEVDDDDDDEEDEDEDDDDADDE